MHSLSGEWSGELSPQDGQRLSGQQGELHASLERIRRWADAHPEVFAGVWLDDDAFLRGTGPVRIGVGIAQRELRQVAPALEALVDDPSRLLLVTKRLPERALRDAQDRVVRRWMRPGDADVTSCGVDIHENGLTVMLSGPDQALEEHIRAENADVPISIVYGHVTPRAATRWQDRRPTTNAAPSMRADTRRLAGTAPRERRAGRVSAATARTQGRRR